MSRIWTTLPLVFGLTISAGFATAQTPDARTGPSEPDILTTLVREASDLTAKRPLHGEDASQTATLFVSEVLYELGIYTGPDTHSFGAECDPDNENDVVWDCRVWLGIRWSDAESAYVAQFKLTPNEGRENCETVYFDSSEPFNACGWTIVDSEIEVNVIG